MSTSKYHVASLVALAKGELRSSLDVELATKSVLYLEEMTEFRLDKDPENSYIRKARKYAIHSRNYLPLYVALGLYESRGEWMFLQQAKTMGLFNLPLC